MKTNRSSFGLPWMSCLMIIVALLACTFATAPKVHAAPPSEMTLMLAQFDAPGAVDSAAKVTKPAPFYTDGAFIGAVVAGFMSLVAVWQNAKKNTAQKVAESLVQAIEIATKIPAVAEKEKAIKQSINRTVTDLGVQPLVHRIVKDVTL